MSTKIKMRFGKYCGRCFDQIPADYLEWLLTQDWLSIKYRREAEYQLAQWEYQRKVAAAQKEWDARKKIQKLTDAINALSSPQHAA